MNLFTKKQTDNSEDYSTLVFPFAEGKNAEDKKEATSASPKEGEDIKVYPGGVSPLNALKKTIEKNLNEGKNVAENIKFFAQDNNPKDTEETESEDCSNDIEITEEAKPKVSLLQKCMPYIFDENGVSQVDTKPDYVLESVEDIILSAEEKAKKRIEKLYKISSENKEKVKSKEVTPIAEDIPVVSAENTSLPTIADILFDDFSGKRTVVTKTESVTTSYSKLTDLQTGNSDGIDGKTIVMPAISESKNTMEDIVSHTKPINIKTAPAIKAAKPFSVNVKSEELLPTVDVDFCSFDDTKKVGTLLKRKRRNAYLGLSATFFLTAISLVLALFLPDHLFNGIEFLPSLLQFGLLVIAAFANMNIFSSLGTVFTKKSTASSPIALAVCGVLVYMVYGLIFGIYPSDIALLPLISLSAYALFSYKRSCDILNNFRIVASHTEKKAVTLIEDQNIATSMARSSISGEVLVAGVRRTSILTDFLRYTSADKPFQNYLGTVTVVFAVLSAILATIIGISHHSFDSALSAAASILCIFAMPTFAFAEFAPLSALSKKLYKMGAMVCGKYSASKIEQANAVVVTSAELFPEGSIELLNMKPLSSNNIDQTLTNAASVAEVIKSPLAHVFNSFSPSKEDRKIADTVKYEDNLGISGWVGDDHYFIGNRTLMEAHGIRVPALEVDRKILHSGGFPVYVAVGQRACALLVIKYKPNVRVKKELTRLINSGITLLVDTCDANITAEMLCDYYSLYADSIKIMDHKGVYNYNKTTNYSESQSSHAAHIGSPTNFFAIINGCLKLHTLSSILYSFHIVLSAIFCVIFALASLDGGLSLLSVSVCLIIEIICIAIFYITYLIAKH